MNPGEDDVPSRLADDARIVPVVVQPEIGLMTVREQRRPRLDVGLDEGTNVGGMVAGDRRKAEPT